MYARTVTKNKRDGKGNCNVVDNNKFQDLRSKPKNIIMLRTCRKIRER